MFHDLNAKMAPTDNVSTTFPEASNLLSFVSSATVNIHEALGKQSKKRTVNIKKYAQKRVKRLEQGNARKGTTSVSSTKSKLAPASTKKQVPATCLSSSLVNIGPSNSWPELPLPPSQPPAAPQTTGLPTTNYSTYSSHPPMQYSYSDPSIYTPPTSTAAPIDDEFDIASLLSDFDSDVPTQQHMSSQPASGSVTPCYTPQPTLETQVALGELPFSPPSDCGSDEIYGDSAYSSPISYSCSPAPMVVSSTNWIPLVHSPPMMMAQCSIACSTTPCNWMDTPMSLPVTTDCTWMAPLTVPDPMPTVVDQGPPATPTVSQVLSEWGFP